jgi:hypothetical protein
MKFKHMIMPFKEQNNIKQIKETIIATYYKEGY